MSDRCEPPPDAERISSMAGNFAEWSAAERIALARQLLPPGFHVVPTDGTPPAEVAALRANVAELVEALEGMLTWVEQRPTPHPYDTWKAAEATLARVRGAGCGMSTRPEDSPRDVLAKLEVEEGHTWETACRIADGQIAALTAAGYVVMRGRDVAETDTPLSSSEKPA